MPILLYCVANREAQIRESLVGIAGIPVDRIHDQQLTVFASSNADSKVWLGRELRASALEFHGVLSEIFQSSAIIPFRFPTILQSQEELTRHLQEKAPSYVAALEKFADLVQMEIRVASRTAEGTRSGTDYLKHRQQSLAAVERFIGHLINTLAPIFKDSRQRPSKEGIRIFCLISRNDINPFENSMRAVALPANIQVRVSGPWPATEFMEQG